MNLTKQTVGLLQSVLHNIQKILQAGERDEFYVRACGKRTYIKFVSLSLLMTAYMTIFQRFPSTSKDFRTCPKFTRTFPNIFLKFPKTFEEDLKIFRSFTNILKYNLRGSYTLKNIVFYKTTLLNVKTLYTQTSKMSISR